MPGVPGLERKVFLSHTAELTSFPRDMSFVAAAERAVTRAGDRAIDMAHFGARDDKPSDFCVQQASECHVYVGLVGFRYGSPVPDSPEVSFTELEFNAATAAGRPRLVFLLDDDAEVPFRKFVDFAYGDRQDRFRARLRDSGIITAGFRTAADLETAVLDALVKLRESQRLAAGFEDNGRRTLSRPGMARRPWMVPDRHGTVVARPVLSTRVLRRLLRTAGRAERRPLVLHGAGGFGKTTLAAEVCRRAEIVERFPGGVLWVTLGESLAGAQLAEKINDLSEALSGVRPALSDPEQAGFRLGELLGDEDRLLVVDDVWQRGQLRPFLQGGPGCVRLITTRLRDLPPAADVVDVPAMTRDEAYELLTVGLGARVPVVHTRRLLVLTGRWPVLLALVNRALVRHVRDGVAPDRAAERVARRLERRGPTALDVSRPEDRAQAVEATLSASLALLTGEQLDRYLELAIFPEDVDIPRATLEILWGATGDLDADEVDDLCEEFADLSLVLAYRHGPQSLLMQDVLRSYLRSRVGGERLRELNGILLDAVRARLASSGFASSGFASSGLADDGPPPWWNLPETVPYLWAHLVYHLAEAGRVDDLRALMRDLRWTLAKLARPALGPVSAEADLAHAERVVTDDPALPALRRALVQAVHLLGPVEPEGSLAAILLSRLDGIEVLAPVCEALAATALGPRLVNRWRRPDQPDPALRRVLPGHQRWVRTIAIARDGSWLASAGDDATIRIWDTTLGASRRILTGHTGTVHAVAISPDDRWLVSAGADAVVRIWDVATGAVRRELTGHDGAVFGCAVAPDGSWLVSAGADGSVRVWDPDAGRGSSRFVLAGHRGAARVCVMTPDGRSLVSSGDDAEIRMWDARTGEAGRVIHTGAGSVLACAVAPDGSWLVSAGSDANVRIWDMATGGQRAVLDGGGLVRACAVDPDGSWLAAAGWDGTVRIWDVRTCRLLAAFAGPSGGSAACTVAADGLWLASGGRYGVVRIWDVPPEVLAAADEVWPAGRDSRVGESAGVGGLRSEPARACAVSPDGSRIVSVTDDGTVCGWDTASGTSLFTLAGETAPPRAACAVAPDGSWFAVPLSAGVACLRDAGTGTVTARLSVPGVALTSWAVAPDGSWLVVACDDGSLRFWDVADATWTGSLTGHRKSVSGCAVSPDGTWVVSVGDDASVRVWDVATRTLRFAAEGHDDMVIGCGIASDGTWFASAGSDRTVRVWDAVTGAQRAVLHGHVGAARSCAVSPDGRWLASDCGNTVRVWDVATWHCVAVARVDGAARACCWLPDSRGLVVAGAGGLYLFELVGTEDLIAWSRPTRT